MGDIDGLIQMCVAPPSDGTPRLILADALKEADETELETALRGPHGEQIIRRLHALADSLKRRACLRLLWTVVVVDRPDTGSRAITTGGGLSVEQLFDLYNSGGIFHLPPTPIHAQNPVVDNTKPKPEMYPKITVKRNPTKETGSDD